MAHNCVGLLRFRIKCRVLKRQEILEDIAQASAAQSEKVSSNTVE